VFQHRAGTHQWIEKNSRAHRARILSWKATKKKMMDQESGTLLQYKVRREKDKTYAARRPGHFSENGRTWSTVRGAAKHVDALKTGYQGRIAGITKREKLVVVEYQLTVVDTVELTRKECDAL